MGGVSIISRIRRSMLYVPGSSLKMLEKAVDLKSDAVILDLEDSVSISEKDAARELVATMLPMIKATGKEALVRINGMDTLWGYDDLKVIVPCKPDTIVLPKASCRALYAADCLITALEEKYNIEQQSIGIITLLETVEAILSSNDILGICKRVNGAQLGAEDLTKELGINRTEPGEEIRFAREMLIYAAKVHGVDAIDTPFTDIKNLIALKTDSEKAKNMGFSGKTCIHPSHIEFVNAAFTPTKEDVEYAKGIITAMNEAILKGKGSCMYQNKMVDIPVANRARKLVEKAEQIARYQDIKND